MHNILLLGFFVSIKYLSQWLKNIYVKCMPTKYMVQSSIIGSWGFQGKFEMYLKAILCPLYKIVTSQYFQLHITYQLHVTTTSILSTTSIIFTTF